MGLSIFLAFWSKVIIVAYLTIFIWLPSVSSTIEKQILVTTQHEALDVFHLSPDGEVVVLQELDMMLSVDQLKSVTAEETSSSRQTRAVMKSADSRWKNGVVRYEIADNIKHAERRIQVAMSTFTASSCIKFEKDSHRVPRVLFTEGKGCWSNIGVKKGAITQITLGRDCQYVSTIIHEIGHALGLFHEHNRPDRDRYIQIDSGIKSKKEWIKVPRSIVVTDNIEYDYRSIMHYSDGIWPRDRKYENIIGSVWDLSFRDLKILNLIYQCSLRAKCDISGRSCKFNGFVLSKRLNEQPPCTCWCDSGDMFNKDAIVPCSSISESKEPVYNLQTASSHGEAGNKTCLDLLPNCAGLKEQNMCYTELARMSKLCAKTCQFCDKTEHFCLDRDESCVVMAESGMCTEKGLTTFMNKECPKSCGQCIRYMSFCDIERVMEGNQVHRSVSCSSVNRQWITAFLVLFLILC